MEEDLEINDPRVEFLADYVLKTMKLRADRWLKMYAAEENKQLCLDFFDKVCRNCRSILAIGGVFVCHHTLVLVMRQN